MGSYARLFSTAPVAQWRGVLKTAEPSSMHQSQQQAPLRSTPLVSDVDALHSQLERAEARLLQPAVTSPSQDASAAVLQEPGEGAGAAAEIKRSRSASTGSTGAAAYADAWRQRSSSSLSLSELCNVVQQQRGARPEVVSTKAADTARMQPLKALARLRLGPDDDVDSVQVSELLPHVSKLIQHWQESGCQPKTIRKNVKALAWLLSLPEVQDQMDDLQQLDHIHGLITAADQAARTAMEKSAPATNMMASVLPALCRRPQHYQQAEAVAAAPAQDVPHAEACADAEVSSQQPQQQPPGATGLPGHQHGLMELKKQRLQMMRGFMKAAKKAELLHAA